MTDQRCEATVHTRQWDVDRDTVLCTVQPLEVYTHTLYIAVGQIKYSSNKKDRLDSSKNRPPSYCNGCRELTTRLQDNPSNNKPEVPGYRPATPAPNTR